MRVYRLLCDKLEERTRGLAAPDGGVSDEVISPDVMAMLIQHATAAT
ncbi:hypothetical protein [Sorangium sp. So ce394]